MVKKKLPPITPKSMVRKFGNKNEFIVFQYLKVLHNKTVIFINSWYYLKSHVLPKHKYYKNIDKRYNSCRFPKLNKWLLHVCRGRPWKENYSIDFHQRVCEIVCASFLVDYRLSRWKSPRSTMWYRKCGVQHDHDIRNSIVDHIGTFIWAR